MEKNMKFTKWGGFVPLSILGLGRAVATMKHTEAAASVNICWTHEHLICEDVKHVYFADSSQI
jgi:hypothetical protein